MTRCDGDFVLDLTEVVTKRWVGKELYFIPTFWAMVLHHENDTQHCEIYQKL